MKGTLPQLVRPKLMGDSGAFGAYNVLKDDNIDFSLS